MKYTVRYCEVDVSGFELYEADFERIAIPECKREAEDSLLKALEVADMEDGVKIVVGLEAEKTKYAEDAGFVFECMTTYGEVIFLYMYCSVGEDKRDAAYKKLCNIDLGVVGFHDYLEEFRKSALPEFEAHAEEYFVDAFEKTEDGHIEIYLEAEKTREKSNKKFEFLIEMGEDFRDVIMYKGSEDNV